MRLHTITLGCLIAVQSFTSSAAAPLDLKRENNFDGDWRFLKADAAGAENAAFNDSAWRTLDLPHDWSLEDLHRPRTDNAASSGSRQPRPTPLHPRGGRGRGGANFAVVGPFSPESPGGAATGYTLGGTGWYRKHFVLDNQTLGKQVTIKFDGVYMDSDVWLNGHHLGNHPYGYTAVCLRPHGVPESARTGECSRRARAQRGQDQPLVFRFGHLPARRSPSDRAVARRPMGRQRDDSPRSRNKTRPSTW